MMHSMGGGGVPWVARRRPQTNTYFYLGVQFNLPDQFPIPDLSPTTVTSGDWGADLCGSSVGRTLQG